MEVDGRTIFLQENGIFKEQPSLSNAIRLAHSDEDVATVYITGDEEDPELTESLLALPPRLLNLWRALYDDEFADCLVVGRDGEVRFPRLILSTLAKGINSVAVGEDGKVPQRILTSLPTLTIEHCKSLMRDGMVIVGSAEIADALGFLNHFFSANELDCLSIGEPVMSIKLPGIACTIERVMKTLNTTKIFADTVIWCNGDTQLRAHWSILRVTSKLLSEVSSPRLLVLSHTKPDIVTQFLRILYTGETMTGGASFMQEMQECAQVFGVQSLMPRQSSPGPCPDWAVRRLTSASHASEQVKMLAELHQEGVLHDATVYSQEIALPIHRLAFGLHSRFSGLIPSLLGSEAVSGCHDFWFLDIDQDTLQVVVDSIYKGQDYDLRKASAPIPCYKPVDDKTPLATREVAITFADVERKENRSGRHVLVTCEYCGYVLRSDKLAGHVRLHTGERPFVCAECGKDFTTDPARRGHSSSSHGPLADELGCWLCGELFPRREFSRHVMDHEEKKEATCEKCSKIFPCQSLCDKHSEQCRTNGNHECTFCSISFISRERLARHTQEKHADDVVQCRQCETVFLSGVELLDHDCPNKASKETEVVYYSCGECPKRFKQLVSLQHHVAIHSGQNPYACEYCDSTFVRPESIKQHMDHFHKNNVGQITSRRKYFICYKCNERFPRVSLFRQHNETEHDGEEFPSLESANGPAGRKRKADSDCGGGETEGAESKGGWAMDKNKASKTK